MISSVYLIFVGFFGLFLGSYSALANTALAIPSSACACDLNQRDEYEGPNQIAFGFFEGQCLDTCRFRRSILVGPNPRTPETRRAVLTNFMHNGAYWKAEIPLSHVESVRVGFEEFMPGIFHVFLLFQFPDRKPVTLSSQVLPQGRASRTKVPDLIISPEGIPPREGKYNFLDAFLERYPVGLRTLSKQQMIHWSVETLKHKVRLFDLNLSPPQREELLRTALYTVDAQSFQTKYKLFTNNCATSVLDLIDSVVKPDVARYPVYGEVLYSIERALPIAGPIGTLQVFLTRNLITESSEHPMHD